MHLKRTIRVLIKGLAANEIFWTFGSPLFERIPYLSFLRKQVLKEKTNKLVTRYFNNLVVKKGVFEGLKYPKLESSGSAIYPKLLGSYEAELDSVFKKILTEPLNVLIDIGCAEGYYLAGFGSKMKNIKLIGIDISEKALQQTKQILLENDIDMGNVSLLKEFDISLIPTNQNNILVICDCEGYEEAIFNYDSLQNYSNCTLLIECHDFIVPNITNKLVNIFGQTHVIEIIKSTADETSKFNFIPLELEMLSSEEKLQLVTEGRPCIMNWIYAKPIIRSAN